jgi:glycine/D-amino acid oxidase-like deaminating enzyme
MTASPYYSSPCGWNALLAPRQAKPLLALAQCDLAVIGAGFSGLAAARRWAELRPGDSIVVLDALTVGEGSPGRNSGFLLEISLAEDADAGAVARMATCNALLRDTLSVLRQQSAGSDLPCALERRGTYRAAVGSAGKRALTAYRRFLEASNLAHEVLDRDALSERLGTGFYSEGLYSPDCSLAQPAALIRAIADSLPANVQLYEDSQATDLLRDGDSWLVSAAGHRLRAGAVILANNAFAAQLHGGADRVVAVYTSAALTEPLTDSQLDQLGSDTDWGLLPAHRLGATLRRTGDGRLLLRSTHSYQREEPPERQSQRLREALARRFPQLALPPFVSSWSGAVGYTQGGGPLWGQLADGLWITAGCNGGGVVKGTLLGRCLAEQALGEETADIPALFGAARWLPPEPLRWLGYRATSAWQSWQGRAEAQGR